MIKLAKAKLWNCETRRVSSDKSEPQSRTRSQRFLARVEWPIDYLKCPSPQVQMCASGNPFWNNDAVLQESGSISWRAEHCLRQMGRVMLVTTSAEQGMEVESGKPLWDAAMRFEVNIDDAVWAMKGSCSWWLGSFSVGNCTACLMLLWWIGAQRRSVLVSCLRDSWLFLLWWSPHWKIPEDISLNRKPEICCSQQAYHHFSGSMNCSA